MRFTEVMRRLLCVFVASALLLGLAEELTHAQPLAPAGGIGVNGAVLVPEVPGYIEVASGGAHLDRPLPMLVLLHGKLGSPENIRAAFANLEVPARIIAVRGASLGPGYVFWDLEQTGLTGEALARAFATSASEAAHRVSGLVRRLEQEKPTLGKPVVAGFSQGAIVSYALAMRDPEISHAFFPLSGFLPSSLIPAAWPANGPRPSIHAFHGARDNIVPIESDRQSVAKLTALGVPAQLSEFPYLMHAVGPLESAALLPEVDAALRREAASGSSPPSSVPAGK
jgi:phospholipase/carboxylesterase